MCKVSVITPVYNVKKYLRECLDSLKAQTMDDIEFVCVDDGATDGCGEILDAYAACDERFRIIHKENSGYGASMNAGLRAARGEYIGIVESDDFADKDMFRALYAAADKYKVDVVKSNYWEEAQGRHRFIEALKGHEYGKAICPRKAFFWKSHRFGRVFIGRHFFWKRVSGSMKRRGHPTRTPLLFFSQRHMLTASS